MIILRQREFGNKANKEAQREWKKKNRHSTLDSDIEFYQNPPLNEKEALTTHNVPGHLRGAGFVNTNKKDQYRTKDVGVIQKHVNKVRGEADKLALEEPAYRSIHTRFDSKTDRVKRKLKRLNSLEKAKEKITGKLTPEEENLWNKDVRSGDKPTIKEMIQQAKKYKRGEHSYEELKNAGLDVAKPETMKFERMGREKKWGDGAWAERGDHNDVVRSRIAKKKIGKVSIGAAIGLGTAALVGSGIAIHRHNKKKKGKKEDDNKN